MRIHEIAAAALVALCGGWMAFDGIRALAVGDYVTPRSGSRSGQLGLWARVVEAIGLDPRSGVVKTAIAAYGLVAVLAAVCLALRAFLPSFDSQLSWARHVVLAVAALGLWYAPVGTIVNLLAIFLLVIFHGA